MCMSGFFICVILYLEILQVLKWPCYKGAVCVYDCMCGLMWFPCFCYRYVLYLKPACSPVAVQTVYQNNKKSQICLESFRQFLLMMLKSALLLA